jgi:hypothetical protein
MTEDGVDRVFDLHVQRQKRDNVLVLNLPISIFDPLVTNDGETHQTCNRSIESVILWIRPFIDIFQHQLGIRVEVPIYVS